MALITSWTRQGGNDADPLQSLDMMTYSRESDEFSHPCLAQATIVIDLILRRDDQDVKSDELTFEDERCNSILVPRDSDLRNSLEAQKKFILHKAWKPVVPQWVTWQKQLVNAQDGESVLKLLNEEYVFETEKSSPHSIREARIYEIDWNQTTSLIGMLDKLGDVLEEDGIVVLRPSVSPEPHWFCHADEHFSLVWANDPGRFEKYDTDSGRDPTSMAEYQWLRDFRSNEEAEESSGTLDREKCHGIYRFDARTFKRTCSSYISFNQKKKKPKVGMRLSFGNVWVRFDPWRLLISTEFSPVKEDDPYSRQSLISRGTIMALQAIPENLEARIHAGCQFPIFPLCIPEYGPDRDKKSAMDRVEHPLCEWYKRLPPYLLASTVTALKLEERKQSWKTLLENVKSDQRYQKILYPSERVGTRTTVRPLEKRHGPLLHASLHVAGSSRLWFALDDKRISKVQSEWPEGSDLLEEIKSGSIFIHPKRLLTAGFICHRQVVGDLVIVHPSVAFETIDRDCNLSSEMDFLTLESHRWFDLRGADYQGSVESVAQIRGKTQANGQRAVIQILDAGINKAAGMCGLPTLGKK